MHPPPRRLVALIALGLLIAAFAGVAQAERRRRGSDDDDEDGLKRILVMPLRGPRGIGARNKIAERIENRSDVVTVGRRESKSPARTARREGADLMVGGVIRCPGRRCKVQIIVYKRSGRVWRKATERVPRADVPDTAADLAEDLLTELEQLHEEVEEEPEEETEEPAEPPEEEWHETFEGGGEEEPEPEPARPARGTDRYRAIEIGLLLDLTVVRNLCMDTGPSMGNDSSCNLDTPSLDDRTYTVTPYGSLGGRIVIFPGAFLGSQPWWGHLGLYFDYSHSLAVSSQRVYQTAATPAEEFTVRIDTAQQDLRVGLIGRIPILGPGGPQFRLFAGFGMYEFSLNEGDYPADIDVAPGYRDSNPYLPTYSYMSIDFGAYFHYPFLEGMLRPYLQIAYRLGVSAGQAGEIFATETSINGVDGELGLVVELGWGIRLAAAMELIYYGTAYAGEVDWSGNPEATWAGTDPGEWSDDTVLRLRLLAGWAF